MCVCEKSNWIGDGYCDDFTNTPDCNFDGGDCRGGKSPKGGGRKRRANPKRGRGKKMAHGGTTHSVGRSKRYSQTSNASMTQKKPRLIILDRDGVINEDSEQYIKSADEWKKYLSK